MSRILHLNLHRDFFATIAARLVTVYPRKA